MKEMSPKIYKWQNAIRTTTNTASQKNVAGAGGVRMVFTAGAGHNLKLWHWLNGYFNISPAGGRMLRSLKRWRSSWPTFLCAIFFRQQMSQMTNEKKLPVSVSEGHRFRTFLRTDWLLCCGSVLLHRLGGLQKFSTALRLGSATTSQHRY